MEISNFASKKPTILYIHMAALGDAIMASPSLKLLKNSLPDYNIYVLTREQSVNYFNSLPFVDTVISFVPNKWLDKKIFNSLIALFLYLDLIKKIRVYEFSAVIQWRGSFIDSIISFSTQAPIRVAAISGLIRKSLLPIEKTSFLVTDLVYIDDDMSHIVDIFIQVVSKTIECITGTFPACQDITMELPTSTADDEYVYTMLSKNRVAHTQKIVAISVGSQTKGNDWSPEYFAKVVDYLQCGLGYCVILTGLANQRTIEEQIIQHASCKPVRGCGLLSISQLASLFKRCSFVVTLNTASMHMASALGIPTVVLFGRDGICHAPWNSKYTFISKNPYFPRRHPDMKQWSGLVGKISPEEVIDAINRLLQ
jgi:ADP-heptose:LPS heptosyltransferase